MKIDMTFEYSIESDNVSFNGNSYSTDNFIWLVKMLTDTNKVDRYFKITNRNEYNADVVAVYNKAIWIIAEVSIIRDLLVYCRSSLDSIKVYKEILDTEYIIRCNNYIMVSNKNKSGSGIWAINELMDFGDRLTANKNNSDGIVMISPNMGSIYKAGDKNICIKGYNVTINFIGNKYNQLMDLLRYN